jgi:hypothetical protein
MEDWDIKIITIISNANKMGEPKSDGPKLSQTSGFQNIKP